MRKIWLILILAIALAGCGQEEETPVFETIGQIDYEQDPLPAAGEIKLLLPEGASSEAMAGEDGAQVYNWDGCELRLETMEAGDIRKTLESVTGVEYEQLTVMARDRDGMDFYETVFTSAGEDGLYIGRVMVADDGNYHYCVSLLTPEEVDSDEIYDQIYSTFAVRDATDSEK